MSKTNVIKGKSILGKTKSIFREGVETYLKDGEDLFVFAPAEMADEVFIGKDDIEGIEYLYNNYDLRFIPVYYLSEFHKAESLKRWGISDSLRVFA